MNLKRLILPNPGAIYSGRLIVLNLKYSNYLKRSSIKIGDSVEVLFDAGPWTITIASIDRAFITARLSAPITKGHTASIPILACLPITSQLEIWEDWIPPLVELGVTHFQPIVYSNSNYREDLTSKKLKKWNFLISDYAEISRCNNIPELRNIISHKELFKWNTSQRLLICNTSTNQPNPEFSKLPFSFTCGPEEGLTHEEFTGLTEAGWQPINLGLRNLRSVIMPIALMGAIQYQINR